MKKILLFLLIVTSYNLSIAQNTAIPNANFEQQLINKGLDVVLDGLVITANIDTLTQLNVASKNISDLTGIEDFTSLIYLNCRGNSLTNLNVTQNTALISLDCGNNQIPSIDVTQCSALVSLSCENNLLTSLNVTQNTALTTLRCVNNQLTNIDVTQNTALNLLQCGFNMLTSLDVTQNTILTLLICNDNLLTNLDVNQNTALTNLNCRFNSLTNLDVTQNTSLTTLYCYNNQITSLDVTQNTVLNDLECYNNQLTSLDVTQNTALNDLECYNNLLTSLDASQNTSLSKLVCNNNQLTCLNARNGNNASISSSWFNTIGNPSLTCIEVDDSAASFSFWNNVDSWTTFSTNCNNTCTNSLCNVTANATSYIDSSGNYIFNNNSTGTFNQTHWAFGDGTTSTLANLNHTFTANGTYVVVLTINDSTVSGSCMDYYLDTIVVTGVVSPLQCAAGFVMYPDAGGVTVVNSSTGTNLTYLWDFGDGNTSNAQYPTHTYATAGHYYLCLTIDDGAGCVDMYCDSIGENGVVFNKQTGFTINVIAPPLVTQVNEQVALTWGMNIYPNPTGNLLNVVLNEKEHYQQTIVAIDGKWLESKTIVGNTTVDVSKYASGMYFITATNNEGKVYQSKFVKE